MSLKKILARNSVRANEVSAKLPPHGLGLVDSSLLNVSVFKPLGLDHDRNHNCCSNLSGPVFVNIITILYKTSTVCLVAATIN